MMIWDEADVRRIHACLKELRLILSRRGKEGSRNGVHNENS